jgi:hypothetical protein
MVSATTNRKKRSLFFLWKKTTRRRFSEKREREMIGKVHRFAHPQNSKKKKKFKTSHLIMILHLVFSAVSCSPEVFLIFRMSVERNARWKKRERARASEESIISCPFPPREFFKNEKIAISIKEEKKMNRARVSKRKHTHQQSATPAGTPSGPVAPPASARARSALSSPCSLSRVFFFFFFFFFFFRGERDVCARILFL